MTTKRPSYFTHLGYSFFGLLSAIWVWSCYIYFFQSGFSYFGLIAFSGIAYFIGSIPFGPIIVKILGLGDLRSIGSGNIGATNVLRTGNKTAALLTLLGDILKGTCAILLYRLFYAEHSEQLALLFGLCAFLGHIFPLWMGFKGGKGVATYLGIIIGLNPLWGLISAVIWVSSAYFSKISSLGALIMAGLTPVYLYFMAPDPAYSIIIGCMSLILYLKHSDNIKRIFKGEESKISLGSKK